MPKTTRNNSENKELSAHTTAKSKTSKNKRNTEIEHGKFLLELYQKALLLSEKELNDYFLNHAVNLTGSSIGFFHFILDDQKLIKLTSWNAQALKNCEANYDTHYPIELAGNWVDCVRLKRPVIYNDFAKSPNQKGFPSGHVLVKRFMSIPIFDNDKVTMIFGVGNKADPYDEDDVVQLQLIANELSKIYKQRQAENTLRESEKQYRSLFENMLDGFAYCKMIFDDTGKPVDFVYLQTNDAFERITGLKRENIIGKKVTEAIPGIEKTNPELFEIYGRVALTCQKEKFEIFFKPLNLWLSISVYCPMKGYFAAVFEDISENKKVEEALSRANEELEERVRKRTMEVSSERQRLYNVLETLPAYVVLLDKDYCVPFANKVFRERFGESHGRHCYDFLFNRNSPCENCETYKVLKTNKPHRWEWTGPDGRDYDIYDFPFVEADGSNLILEMGIDITERKRAEKKLHAASLYSRSLIEASLDPLVTISAEGKITDVNQATELATGCSREELIGSDFSDYFTEPEKAKIGYKQVFTEGLVRDYRLAIRDKSGKITDVLYNATIYTNEAGEMQGVFAAARDITRRKEAEERYQTLFDSIDEGFCIIEMVFDSAGKPSDYRFLDVNASFERQTGLHDAKGKLMRSFAPNHEAYWFEIYGKVALTGRQIRFTNEAKALNRWYDVFAFPVGEEKIRKVGILFNDITQRMNLEKQLKDSERLATIGATAGMVGHDIRNPLQAITSDVYLVKSDLAIVPEGEEKESMKESLEGIEKNVEYVNKIVRDLQDYARPLKPDAKEFDLEDMCREVLQKNALPQNVKSSCQIDKEAKKVMVDPEILRRILTNLVTNAAQAMPQGGKLSVRGHIKDNELFITVQDTGVGIPEDARDKLFTPLFTTKSKGQGFGLAVVKRMTESLGGNVTFESQEGKGTTFMVRLPLQGADR